MKSVSLLKKLVKFVCPSANGAYVKPQESLLFRCGRDGEGMPFILGNGWYSQEDVVSRLVVEFQWAGEDKMCHL